MGAPTGRGDGGLSGRPVGAAFFILVRVGRRGSYGKPAGKASFAAVRTRAALKGKARRERLSLRAGRIPGKGAARHGRVWGLANPYKVRALHLMNNL